MRNLNFHADIAKICLTRDRLLSHNQGHGQFLDRLDRKLSKSLLAVGKFGAVVVRRLHLGKRSLSRYTRYLLMKIIRNSRFWVCVLAAASFFTLTPDSRAQFQFGGFGGQFSGGFGGQFSGGFGGGFGGQFSGGFGGGFGGQMVGGMGGRRPANA